MTEPRTEAGRRLWESYGGTAASAAIARIEAEAVAAYAADLRAKVQTLRPIGWHRGHDVLDRAAVLALLDTEGNQP